MMPLFAACFTSAVFMLFTVGTAAAATIQVTTSSDNGTGADCSLREAVIAANTNVAFGGCPDPRRAERHGD